MIGEVDQWWALILSGSVMIGEVEQWWALILSGSVMIGEVDQWYYAAEPTRGK